MKLSLLEEHEEQYLSPKCYCFTIDVEEVLCHSAGTTIEDFVQDGDDFSF